MPCSLYCSARRCSVGAAGVMGMAQTEATKARTATEVNARITVDDSDRFATTSEFDRSQFKLNWCSMTLIPRFQSLNNVPGRVNDFPQESDQEWHKGRNESASERTVPTPGIPI
jgi:hypothetical protein